MQAAETDQVGSGLTMRIRKGAYRKFWHVDGIIIREKIPNYVMLNCRNKQGEW